jgi:hypothetical protein
MTTPQEAATPRRWTIVVMSTAGTEGLRSQLLDGLPARVQGMAEALILEWETAVAAVPELAHAASSELIALLRMEPAEREAALRLRWLRAGEREIDVVGVEAPRERTPSTGSTAA